jgi:hypothetical protein
MNPTCCEVKAKRGWAHCPICGDYIDWPVSKKENAKRLKAHDARMKADPDYSRRHQFTALVTSQQWKARIVDYLGGVDPIIPNKLKVTA